MIARTKTAVADIKVRMIGSLQKTTKFLFATQEKSCK